MQHEIENLLFADPLPWSMRNCGKAASQLRGDSGGPVEQYPPFAPVLARAREKGLGVDGETWLNPSVTFSDFEYNSLLPEYDK